MDDQFTQNRILFEKTVFYLVFLPEFGKFLRNGERDIRKEILSGDTEVEAGNL